MIQITPLTTHTPNTQHTRQRDVLPALPCTYNEAICGQHRRAGTELGQDPAGLLGGGALAGGTRAEEERRAGGVLQVAEEVFRPGKGSVAWHSIAGEVMI